MKTWLYAAGLLLLPLAYVGVMSTTGQPVEWYVLGLMALIVAPVLLFRKSISATERKFNAMSGKEQLETVAKAARTVSRHSGGGEA